MHNDFSFKAGHELLHDGGAQERQSSYVLDEFIYHPHSYTLEDLTPP